MTNPITPAVGDRYTSRIDPECTVTVTRIWVSAGRTGVAFEWGVGVRRAASALYLDTFDAAYEPAAPAAVETGDRAALRDRIAAALYERERPPREPHWPDAFAVDREVFEAMADAVLAVLPEPTDQAAAEPPLSPYYEHPACGFHWHGRDGMDIPMRDGQPVCPRCELRDQAAVLNRLRATVHRLAAHAVGFQDVLDEFDRGPWGKTVGADIAELRRLADEQPAPTTPFTPPAHYRRDDGVNCCVHTIPIGPDSCPACRELADDEPAGPAAPTKEAPTACRTFISGGAVWCCEEGETDCPCACHQPDTPDAG